jgi:hypothetical protein
METLRGGCVRPGISRAIEEPSWVWFLPEWVEVLDGLVVTNDA